LLAEEESDALSLGFDNAVVLDPEMKVEEVALLVGACTELLRDVRTKCTELNLPHELDICIGSWSGDNTVWMILRHGTEPKRC
jgi:hypothetical protein